MSITGFAELAGDDGIGELVMKAVKLEHDLSDTTKRLVERQEIQLQKSLSEVRSPCRSSNCRSGTSSVDQVQSPLDDTGPSSTSHLCPAPICRQFWKAGAYNDGARVKASTQNGKNYLHVHPMFLHSNATSHKWAFGAIAELLDNAVDEIQNGATFVIVDKTVNPRDGRVALLIQDDGGGMGPEALRRCMSFGFSDKSKGIGKYGNGFKTSTMRLGADVIVFSRPANNRMATQSIGLLSYTFLSQKEYDRIVVPVVDYEFNPSTQRMERSYRYSEEHFMSNLSLLLQWSPYSSEADLLKQFDDVGSHGTKVIIYNLWFNDDGKQELDFDFDPKDIRINGDKKKVDTIPAWREVNEQNIANRLQYSLRVYVSILYLRMPESFSIILRGQVVEHHNIADDLKFIEYILYRPQTGGFIEGQVVTTVGFLKEAPHVNIHGFNVYHKNRLILPFWQVVSYADSRGRGVVGVLEANFIEPIHNKQDFERTSLFQKLEVRLKEMTWEYWDYHCGLIGYQARKKARPSLPSKDPPVKPLMVGQNAPGISHINQASYALEKPGSNVKRKDFNLTETVGAKRHASEARVFSDDWSVQEIQPVQLLTNQSKDQEATNLMQERKKLQAKCLEFEKSEKELNDKLSRLMSELEDAQRLCTRLQAEVESLDHVKEERVVKL